jgi:hypothetical protein
VRRTGGVNGSVLKKPRFADTFSAGEIAPTRYRVIWRTVHCRQRRWIGRRIKLPIG